MYERYQVIKFHYVNCKLSWIKGSKGSLNYTGIIVLTLLYFQLHVIYRSFHSQVSFEWIHYINHFLRINVQCLSSKESIVLEINFRRGVLGKMKIERISRIV